MDLKAIDLKKTVNLPRTDFSMKANLPQTEPKMLAHWHEMGLYQRIREVSHGRPRYVLHDGPPYANGNIHLGHAYNKTLKDFIVKSKTMAGFDSPYIPGWDCHGLPIEIKVDNQLGPRKASMTPAQIRGECRQYAARYVELQKQDFIRLGVFGRWDDPYLTMAPRYQAVIAGAFVDMLDKGYVYKGLKPVNWCLNCKTALAEAEVEYEDHSSPSIWVRFALTSDPARIHETLAGRRVYAVIWTTTPWTIPANMAIAYNPKFDYDLVDVNGDVYIVAHDLVAETASACGWAEARRLGAVEGSRMDGSVFRHPFLARRSLGVLGDHVTLEQGTGAVHTAPGHGAEDCEVARRYGIPIFCPVAADGRIFQAEGAEGQLPAVLLGKTVWEVNPVVIDLLSESGALLAQKQIRHSYPHCWRCDRPTIFRATEQWFIGMENNQLRQQALSAVRQTRWMQAWGDDRLGNMIRTRPDWCISRQRTWGVPLVMFYCEDCGHTVADRKVLDRVVRLFAEHSADVWYEWSAAALAGEEARCGNCGSARLRKENDILDVWFDSGCSHLAVIHEQNELEWPSDLYLEGGDQYRGWFQSSLLVGVALRGRAPFREVATHGFTLDAQGYAMSKSRGNVIPPEDIIRKYGAEVLRLWVASAEYSEDVRISNTILERLADAYRKLRNTFRFALGNLSDFDPQTDLLPAAQLLEMDQWMLWRTDEMVRSVLQGYQDFLFHRVYQILYNFAVTDLSAVYFDVLKDRLYTSAARSPARRSAQTALYRIQDALVRLLAPLMVFTTDEAWGHMRKPPGAPDSVHLALFPQPGDLTAGFPEGFERRASNWQRLMEVRELVLKSLEAARQNKFIGAPLDARVNLKAGPDYYPLLDAYARELAPLFIVSQVELRRGSEHGLSVHIERAAGTKCERCWKYSSDVGAHPEFPTICAACATAVLASVDGRF